MEFTPSKLNAYLFAKLPSAYWSGVRVSSIDENKCIVCVKHKWFNQNPFKSMYFAVQAMAAELSTGALVMLQIQKSKQKISMLVANNNGSYAKKATGKITFTCNDGSKIKEAINLAIETGEGQKIWMQSIGKDEVGDQVSEMNFEWTIKVKRS
ncbi:DUF4442 domain-containing protein [Flavobacterium sp. I3-2]|uniref:DUF4442 domain-containing protein n=1 Tax=Flavobacterium sp. I3-2 TaxID=2748319 RepID=UPI0015AF3CE4|nr:DUF4442 domain-containing protein [Flavobacterium sp. I3-2]